MWPKISANDIKFGLFQLWFSSFSLIVVAVLLGWEVSFIRAFLLFSCSHQAGAEPETGSGPPKPFCVCLRHLHAEVSGMHSQVLPDFNSRVVVLPQSHFGLKFDEQRSRWHEMKPRPSGCWQLNCTRIFRHSWSVKLKDIQSDNNAVTVSLTAVVLWTWIHVFSVEIKILFRVH